MKYCIKCLQPDTRPNTYFSDSGLCPACDYSEKLQSVDWGERFQILTELTSRYRSKNRDKFDCIVGVSGGKDSTRQALWVRDKLDMNPLLVCVSYPPEQTTEIGVQNISNLIELGFDVVWSAPAPETWRSLMREGFLRFANWAKSTELALFGSVPQIAIRYQIPLIFWGENPGLQLGDMATLGNTGYDGNNLRNMNTLQGGGLQWLLKTDVDSKKLFPYQYPTETEFTDVGIQIVYLGWFLQDWSLLNNAMHSVTNGLRIRTDRVENSGDLFGVTSLDEDWVSLNQMIKYYKYGFGRVTDYVNESIRLGLVERQEAIPIIERFDGSCGPKYIQSFCKFIEISEDIYWNVVRKSVNKELFDIDTEGIISRRFEVGVGL